VLVAPQSRYEPRNGKPSVTTGRKATGPTRAAELPKGRPVVSRLVRYPSLGVYLKKSICTVLIALGAFAADVQVASAGVEHQPSFFGSVEVQQSRFSNLKKWDGLIARHDVAMGQAQKCTYQQSVGCAQQEWQGLVDDLKELPPQEMVAAVNQAINRFDYAEDAVTYGHDDYWATPMEFFTKGGGDCEDFAIAKYALLRAMGISEDLMRIVIVETDTGTAHAVLVIDSEQGQIVLDNQSYRPAMASAISNYQPIFSVNAHHLWVHITM
jgi:predicted transglutaminase-like cysteine proteinase